MTEFIYKSPIGNIKIIEENDSIISIRINDDADDVNSRGASQSIGDFSVQLDEYFNGKRKQFNIDYKLEGTDFQKKVWSELVDIPYGETRSYKEIASALGSSSAARAVGAACRQNPLPIVIPCHRVIGSDGSLTGFGGGLEKKSWLLEHEKNNMQ